MMAEITRLRGELEAMRRDLESGFMAGAYARLKNLQKSEAEVSRLTERVKELEDIAQRFLDGDEDGARLAAALSKDRRTP